MKQYIFFILGTAVLTWGICRTEVVLMVCGFIGLGISVYMHFKSRHSLKERCEIMLEAIRNKEYSFRLPLNGKLGNERILQETLNEFGNMMGKQKQEMEVREMYYKHILESVTTGIIVLDERGRIMQSNEAAARLLSLPSLATLDQLNQYGDNLPQRMRNLSSGESIVLHFTTQRGESNLTVRAVNMMFGNNENVKVLAINDIRSEMDAKEQESWVRLTRVLTHEIMNSIAPITSLSETMMNGDMNNAEMENGIKAIYETSAGLMEFVESYRKYSNIQQPNPLPFYLFKLLTGIERLGILPDGVKLTMQLQPKDMMIYADPNLVRQVFINLFKNASEAMDCEGKILVHAYIDKNEHTFIQVSNNGPVISKEERENIFVPFFTTKSDGNGIGLSLCRRIMKMSGGRISLLPTGTNGWNTSFLLEFE